MKFMIALDDSIGNYHFVHFGLIAENKRKLLCLQIFFIVADRESTVIDLKRIEMTTHNILLTSLPLILK